MAIGGHGAGQWWRRWRRRAAGGWDTVRAHADAEVRLLPGRYGPWRRVIRDGRVCAERRRPDGSVADRLPWGAYCALRARHRRLADGARAFVRRHRWRWLARAVFGWLV